MPSGCRPRPPFRPGTSRAPTTRGSPQAASPTRSLQDEGFQRHAVKGRTPRRRTSRWSRAPYCSAPPGGEGSPMCCRRGRSIRVTGRSYSWTGDQPRRASAGGTPTRWSDRSPRTPCCASRCRAGPATSGRGSTTFSTPSWTWTLCTRRSRPPTWGRPSPGSGTRPRRRRCGTRACRPGGGVDGLLEAAEHCQRDHQGRHAALTVNDRSISRYTSRPPQSCSIGSPPPALRAIASLISGMDRCRVRTALREGEAV